MSDWRPMTDEELARAKAGQYDYVFVRACLCGEVDAWRTEDWYIHLSLGFPSERESDPCPACGRVYRIAVMVKGEGGMVPIDLGPGND